MLRLLVVLVGFLSGVCCADAQALKAVLSDPTGSQLVGFANWSADNTELRANVEIPDLKMTLDLRLQRHAIGLVFKLPPDFPHGGIANVPGILMKNGETTRGVPLNGSTRKVIDNAFLIVLADDAENIRRNLQLMRERTWFDVPIVYGDGNRAILAVEKGDTQPP